VGRKKVTAAFDGVGGGLDPRINGDGFFDRTAFLPADGWAGGSLFGRGFEGGLDIAAGQRRFSVAGAADEFR
jgi:hypothetical protein